MQVLQCQQKLFFAFLLNASLEIIALRQTKPLRYLCMMHKNIFFCGLETLKIIVLVTQILLKKNVSSTFHIGRSEFIFSAKPTNIANFCCFQQKNDAPGKLL